MQAGAPQLGDGGRRAKQGIPGAGVVDERPGLDFAFSLAPEAGWRLSESEGGACKRRSEF